MLLPSNSPPDRPYLLDKSVSLASKAWVNPGSLAGGIQIGRPMRGLEAGR